MTNEETMAVLKATLLEKEFASYMQVSFVARQDVLHKLAIEEISRSIVDTLIANARQPMNDTARVFLKSASADPLAASETIGASVRAIADENPAAVLCFMAHLLQEAQRKKESESNRANLRMKEYAKLLEQVAVATSLKGLRKAIRESAEEDDY
jgi:hypothetical protein